MIFSLFLEMPSHTESTGNCELVKTDMGLTQAAVGHHDVHMTATLLAALLAPVLDADWLVGLHHVGNLELWVHLHTQERSKKNILYQISKTRSISDE